MQSFSLLVLGALTIVLAWIWLAADRAWRPPPAQLLDPAVLTLPDADSPAAARTDDTIAARPLFSPDRRPAEGVATTAGGAPDTQGVELIGVFVSNTGSGVILLIEGNTRRLRLGEMLGSLTLASVTTHDAHLADPNGNELRLELRPGRHPLAVSDDGRGPIQASDDASEDNFEDPFPNPNEPVIRLIAEPES